MKLPPVVSLEPSFCASMSFQPRLAVTPEATAYEIPSSVTSFVSSVEPLAVPRVPLSSPSPDVKPALRVTSPATYLTPTFVTVLSNNSTQAVELCSNFITISITSSNR